MKLMHILGLLLCGAMAACGTEGSSPSENSNNAGASGSGGNPDSPPDNGGGNGGDDTNAGGGGGEAGSIGGEGGDPGVGGQLITSDVGVGGDPGGEGGFGGQIATGGSGGSPSSDCPASIDEMEPNSPCLVAGSWNAIDSVGWVEMTLTKSDDTFHVHIEGENTFLVGLNFTGSTLPLEHDYEEQGVEVHHTVDVDAEGYLTFTSAFNGMPNGEEKYERN